MPESRGLIDKMKWAFKLKLQHEMKEKVRTWAVHKSHKKENRITGIGQIEVAKTVIERQKNQKVSNFTAKNAALSK